MSRPPSRHPCAMPGWVIQSGFPPGLDGGIAGVASFFSDRRRAAFRATVGCGADVIATSGAKARLQAMIGNLTATFFCDGGTDRQEKKHADADVNRARHTMVEPSTDRYD